MKSSIIRLGVAIAALFYCSVALAQNSGTATSHAFAVGKGASKQGFSSVLCTLAQIPIGQTTADPICRTLAGDVTIDGTGATVIGANKITNALFRQSGALALVGRSANTTGNVADIQATAGSSCVFLESASSLTCATIATANITNNAVTFAKFQQIAALSMFGNCTNALANGAAVTGTANQVLRVNGAGTSCAFGAVDLSQSGAVANTLPFTNLPTLPADNVAGNPTAGAAVIQALALVNCSNALTYSTSTHTFGCNAVAGTGTVTSAIIAAGAGISVTGTCTITTSGTCTVAQSLTSATLQASPANPTGTASVTSVMMGLGATCKITPVYSARVKLEFYGNVSTTAAGNNSFVKASFNNGTAPINGAAFTGTLVGTEQQIFSSSASVNQEFMVGGIITGLTPGTAYWFDLGIRAPSGTSTAISISCNAMEF